MPAKSMYQTKINKASNLIQDIAVASNSYYIAIGKSDAWSDTDTDFTDDELYGELVNGATRTLNYESQIRQNFLAMKKLSTPFSSHAIRRYDWVSGQTYVAWDSGDEDIFTKRFYVVTQDLRVYKCITAGVGASTISPTHTNNTPTAEADGYVWRFMYSISAVQSTRFLTTNYIPVKTVTQSGVSTEDDIQLANQNISSNIAGKIYNIRVVNGGSGYTSATVAIEGNGTGATATATIVDGVITKITITNSGSDYTVAKLVISGDGTNAVAYPILSPLGGHGADPVKELGGEYLLVSFTLVGDEEGTFIVNDDFRQVSLVKNPFDYSTTTISTAERLVTLPTMRLNSTTNGEIFTVGNIGDVIYDTSDTTIRAFVTSYDTATGDLQYTQNDKTGYKSFIQGNTITSVGGATGTIATLAQATPDVDVHTGDILITNNIQAVNRTTAGQESLTFIIQH